MKNLERSAFAAFCGGRRVRCSNGTVSEKGCESLKISGGGDAFDSTKFI